MSYDLRIGKIVKVQQLEDVKYVTHKLVIDFGSEIGLKTSLASLVRYKEDQLIGRFIAAIVDLPSKKIGTHLSEVVILGTPNAKKECILLIPDSEGAVVGEKVF